jgi:3-oxoacyl-[acyl-carrier protein] reductase
MMAQAPVEDSEGLKRLASQVAGRYGKVDLLVNNAGITRFVAHDDLEGLDDDLIDEIFRVNWRGAFACVRAFKDLLASGDGGLVVNISSIAGISGIGSNVAYCASKAALSTMTVSLARALAPAIRVVAIAPGLVEGRYAEKLDPAWRREQEAKAPLKRLVKPEDVANAVLALATQLTFSTGITIVVDGGRLLV